MKVIQAIDPSNAKSEADIKAIYNVEKLTKFAEDVNKYGVDKAVSLNPDVPVNAQELKALRSAGLGPKNGKMYTPTLYYSNGNTCEWKKSSIKVDINTDNNNGKKADVSAKSASHTTPDLYFITKCGENGERPMTPAEIDAYNKTKK